MKNNNTKQLQMYSPINSDDKSQEHKEQIGDDWLKLSRYLREGFGESAYTRWLQHIEYLGEKNISNAMLLCVPSEFIKTVILQSYFKDIASFVHKHCKSTRKIEIIVRSEKITCNDYKSNQDEERQVTSIATKASTISLLNIQCDQTYFEDFIYDHSNELAYLSALQVSNRISQSSVLQQRNGIFPCLCIFGPVGMGKTHLLKSIVTKVKISDPNCNIAYLTADQFRQQYIQSIRTQQLFEFKKWFSELDAIVVDDVQFICSADTNNKNNIEKEFSRILDNLIDNGRWIIIACDRPPSDLDLDCRTKSRISSGLTVNIQASEYDLRLRILQSKIQKIQDNETDMISVAMLQHIAEHVCSSIRELEAVLYNIVTYIKVMKVRNIPNDIVDKIMYRTGIGRTNDKIISINDSDTRTVKKISNFDSIMDQVCTYYGVNQSDIIGSSRVQKISKARAITAYMAREKTSMTLKEIGRRMGNRSHATIMHLIKLCESDSNYKQDIERIISSMN